MVPGLDSHETLVLVCELLIEATLGGVRGLDHPEDRAVVMRVASGAVDDGLVAALQDKPLSATERLHLRALRAYLYAKVQLLIDKEAQDLADGGAEASPVSWSKCLQKRFAYPKTAFEQMRNFKPIVGVPGSRMNLCTMKRGYCSNFSDGCSGSANQTDNVSIYDRIGPVYNTVTWCLNGPMIEVQDNFDRCTGHQRLYHCINGQILDISKFLGGQKFIFTTAVDGTFYFKITFTEYDPSSGTMKNYWVKMITDAREGWNYGFENKNGTFEYQHEYDSYITATEKQDLDFRSDYSFEGIAPLGHGRTLMGLPAIQIACKIISEYDGCHPSPPQVQMACSILVNYGCESWKLHNIHEANSMSLLGGTLCTLDEWSPTLSLTMKNWSKLSEAQLHCFLRCLYSPHLQVIPKLPNLEGKNMINDVCDLVAIIPFNRVPRLDDSNKRNWTWSPVDQGGEGEGGRPHYLSMEFLKRWPFHKEVVSLREKEKIVDLTVAGPRAKSVHRSFRQNLLAGIVRPQTNPSKASKLALSILRWLIR